MKAGTWRRLHRHRWNTVDQLGPVRLLKCQICHRQDYRVKRRRWWRGRRHG